MKKSNLIISLLGVFLPWSASADSLSYDYLEVSFNKSRADVAGETVTGDGFVIDGSFAVSKYIAVIAAYGYYTFEVDIDNSHVVVVGANLHAPVSENTNLELLLGLRRDEISSPLGKVEDTGNVVGFGVRSGITSDTQISAGVQRIDLFDGEVTGYGVELIFGTPSGPQVVIGYAEADDEEVMRFGIRGNFGR